jgi:hypothetical protein
MLPYGVCVFLSVASILARFARYRQMRWRLQHFHFWCLQSNYSHGGFSSRTRGPRQACLLGWKKSRTSPHPPVQSRSENALEEWSTSSLFSACTGTQLGVSGHNFS